MDLSLVYVFAWEVTNENLYTFVVKLKIIMLVPSDFW